MTRPTVLMTPRRPALLSGVDNTVDFLLRVQAPSRPETGSERSPLNLAIVLDRSGSMSGQPLDEAKRCAGMIVDRLGPRDRVALVVYDHDVAVLVPTTRIVDRTTFHAAIASIDAGGMTNLHGGWLKGAELLAPVAQCNAVTRVLLLSDGQANQGMTDLETIARQCAGLAGVGITTSTYGLGAGFNEDLMIRMATAGHGNAYYGETAEDLVDPFAEEFDLLAALCARRICLRVDAPEGVSAAVLNRFSRHEDDGSYRMPDLAYEGESWAVIRLTVPKAHAGTGGRESVALGAVAISCQDPDGNVQTLPPVTVELPSLPAAAFAAVAEDPLVAARTRELEAADIQDRAQRAARHGDWAEVRRLLADARENAKDNEWLGRVVDKLERLAESDQAMFSKEAMYASRKMRSRLAGVSEWAPAAMPTPSYLRRKAEQGKALSGRDDM